MWASGGITIDKIDQRLRSVKINEHWQLFDNKSENSNFNFLKESCTLTSVIRFVYERGFEEDWG